jgi:hypothetical protein
MRFLRRRTEDIGHTPLPADEVAPPEPASTLAQVALFLADRIQEGLIETHGQRVSDVLKTADPILLQLADESGAALSSTYPADDVVAVAVPPAPQSPKRVSRRRHLVTINAGPYSIQGEAHMPPGADPLRYIDNAPVRWLPITDCTVSNGADAWQVDVVIVNTDHVRRTSATAGS